MIRTGSLILALAAVLSAASGFTALLQAQEKKEGIGISPTSLTLEAEAGREITGEVTVINPGDEAVSYRLYASSFRVRNEDYEKEFDLDDSETAAPVSWFALPSEPKQLAGNGQEKVRYSIQIPADAASQGYYGVIFAETTAEKADESGVVRKKRVGSLVYLTVKGVAVQRGGHVASFQVKGWQHNSPVKAVLRVSNKGNVHFPVDGQIQLKNAWGKVIHQSEISSVIIPETTRRLIYELPPSRSVGLYRVEGHVSLLDQSVPLKSSWVLLASPLWLVMWLAALLALTVVWVLLRRRQHGRLS